MHRQPGFVQQGGNLRQNEFGLPVAGFLMEQAGAAVVPQRQRQPLGGGIDGEQRLFGKDGVAHAVQFQSAATILDRLRTSAESIDKSAGS